MGKNDEFGDKLSSKQFTEPRGRAFKLLNAAHQLRQHNEAMLILCYHGVSKSDEHVWNPRLYIDVPAFRRHLETIREFGYQVLPLAGALQQMREKTLSGPTVVITFDDGWHDFQKAAWPVLQEFGYPATVYQTTYYAQYNRPVFDPACGYLLWKGSGRIIEHRDMSGGRAQLDLRVPGAVEIARKRLLRRAAEVKLSAEQKDVFLQHLAEGVDVNYRSMLEARTLHLMNEAEVGEMAEAGVDIQLHTHRHRLPANKADFFRELDGNRDWIEGATGRTADHFCYPNGSHRPELVGWLREAGVRSATTCEPGRASYKSEQLLLPRFTDSGTITQAKFESWLAGFGLIAPRCKRALRSVFGRGSGGQAPAEEADLVPTNQRVSEASAAARAVKTSV